MTDDATARLERVLAMSERLISAIDGDIEALQKGAPGELKTIEPETQRLAVLYERELTGLSAKDADRAPMELVAQCTSAANRLRERGLRQQRLLKRMRHVSEGMIRAIAKELEDRQAGLRPYRRRPAAGQRTPTAMIYNNVA